MPLPFALPADPMITAKQIGGIRIPCCERDINGDGNCDRHPASIEDVLRYYLRKEESRPSCDLTGDSNQGVRAINGALDQLSALQKDRARLDWLDATRRYSIKAVLGRYEPDLRSAIDAAKAEDPQ